jgi:hypothetical protein
LTWASVNTTASIRTAFEARFVGGAAFFFAARNVSVWILDGGIWNDDTCVRGGVDSVRARVGYTGLRVAGTAVGRRVAAFVSATSVVAETTRTAVAAGGEAYEAEENN